MNKNLKNGKWCFDRTSFFVTFLYEFSGYFNFLDGIGDSRVIPITIPWCFADFLCVELAECSCTTPRQKHLPPINIEAKSTCK